MRARIVLALALTGLTSCGDGGVNRVFFPDPRPAEDLRLGVVASPPGGQAGQPVTITASLRNLGRQAVALVNLCPEPTIRILDAQDIELFQRDPTRPVACPLFVSAPLEPGARLDVPLTFDGGYFSSDGQHHQASAGTYRAVATFVYSSYPDPGAPRTLTQEVHFTWQ
jgi:hypothetical protein